jgi:transposase
METIRQFEPEFIVKIIKDHIEGKVNLDELYQKYGIETELLNKWKSELFDRAVMIFSNENSTENDSEYKLRLLEKKIKQKEKLILELERDNYELKRMLCSINDEFEEDNS